MSKKKEYTYTQYLDNSKKLFKQLFGSELYKKLNSTPLKSIDWQGIDVDTSDILATFPNIKQRFCPDWIEYWKDHEITLLDLYIQVIFHYGYQQCEDHNEGSREGMQKLLDMLLKEKK
jgi:hypothetical protein